MCNLCQQRRGQWGNKVSKGNRQRGGLARVAVDLAQRPQDRGRGARQHVRHPPPAQVLRADLRATPLRCRPRGVCLRFTPLSSHTVKASNLETGLQWKMQGTAMCFDSIHPFPRWQSQAGCVRRSRRWRKFRVVNLLGCCFVGWFLTCCACCGDAWEYLTTTNSWNENNMDARSSIRISITNIQKNNHLLAMDV